MKAININSPLLLISIITGCAHYFPPSQDQRIVQYKKNCEIMGFKNQTIEHSNCVLELEKSYLSRSGVKVQDSSSMNSDARTQEMIDNDRARRQILNHGAGGCTPNFSTGGCL